MQTDVLVIGGGATGAGTALDLALRGLRVILVERADLADGTSGRYHGLLHSGGRYAVRDPESARECIVENQLMRRIAPHVIEDTGGLFVTTPDDDPAYAETWLAACRACGIEAHEIPVAQALARESALNPRIARAFLAPDAACDSFDLLYALAGALQAHAGAVLTYHAVTGLTVTRGRVSGATLRNARTGESIQIAADMVVNAAGPWAGQVAALAGCPVGVRLSKGALVATAYRCVNTIVNRCRLPGDGDILVPVGTVAVIGTTSVGVDEPNDNGVSSWEVHKLLDEGEKLVPGFGRLRMLRAWAGVRPLYEEAGQAQGREAKRTFAVLDHETRDGVAGLVTVLGGKLTTWRLMAEKTADMVAARLGVDASCVTCAFPLSDFRFRSGGAGRPTCAREAATNGRLNALPARLKNVEAAARQDGLICECELITRAQIEQAARDHPAASAAWILDDLRRDLRLGMGPCQGGFCGYRTVGLLHERAGVTAAQATRALADFVQRRWKGQRPLLWGHGVRQALLDEQIYRDVLGLDLFDVSR